MSQSQPDDFDEAAWAKERAAYGWLGRPPHEVTEAPYWVWQKWVKLSKEAKKVVRMRPGQPKIEAGKRIVNEREAIIEQARQAIGAGRVVRPADGAPERPS